MNADAVIRMLGSTGNYKASGRAPLLFTAGVPDNTNDIGWIAVDTTNNDLYFWTGSAWTVSVNAAQGAAITSLTDSTTGTPGNTVDDTTASVKDDIASLAAKINSILTALRTYGIIAT